MCGSLAVLRCPSGHVRCVPRGARLRRLLNSWGLYNDNDARLTRFICRLDAFRDGIMAQTSSNKSFKRTASITSLAPLSPAGPDATGAAAAPALSDVQDL